jgi:hypothetical protein
LSSQQLITQSMGYDDFRGPQLDPDLWAPFAIDGIPRLEPGATTTFADGVLTVDIPEFENANAEDPGFDGTKHVVVSTRGFAIPEAGPVRFEAEMAVDHVGVHRDYRLGVAAFVIVDTEGSSGAVLNFLATADRVYAEQEISAVTGGEDPYTRIVESPFVPVRDGFRHLVVEIDRSAGRVTWTADGESIHDALGLEGLPDSVHIGFAFFTNTQTGVPSNHGQGARASWRNFRYSLLAVG